MGLGSEGPAVDRLYSFYQGQGTKQSGPFVEDPQQSYAAPELRVPGGPDHFIS